MEEINKETITERQQRKKGRKEETNKELKK